ncbi:MAG: hypothetical protein AAGG48_28655 [Planctomycetota bacterium]
MAVYRFFCATFLLMVSLLLDVSYAQEDEGKKDVDYTKIRQAIEDATTLKYTLMSFQEGDDDAMDVGFVDRVEHQAPNFWRHTALDDSGKVKSIHIVDTTGKKQLYLDMKSKTATWLPHPIHVYGDIGMLDWMASFIKKMPKNATGQRATGDGKADVFKVKTVELWFDAETKSLVGLSLPEKDPEFSTELSDLSKAPTTPRPGKSLGRVYKDIEYGVEFDEDRFEMNVPEGFDVMEWKPPVIESRSKT